MTNQHFARIEAQIERLIEGTFAHLFRQHISAHDLLLHLTRAFEEAATTLGTDNDPRPVCADRFEIRLQPEVYERFNEQQEYLLALLGEHISELANNYQYRLLRMPTFILIADTDLGPKDILVYASQQTKSRPETASLKRVDLPTQTETQRQYPHFILDGQETIPLTQDIINLGRSRDNDIVLNNPTVSRHHAQLRLRFGAYTLFDNDSQHGTYVNDVRIREHRLQPGDVVRMGNARLIYIDDPANNSHTQTQIYPLLSP